jgi:glycosyltransferase involved in cell wall biosynthesis
MFVVHWSNWGPRISGMYESCKNQCKYETRAGIRSELAISYEAIPTAERNDKGFLPITWEEAKKADVWDLHSAFPDKAEMKKEQAKKVTVAVLHGPTEHMVFKEWEKVSDSFNLHVNLLWKMDATVCINTHEYDVMKLYDEKVGRCRYIPNSIDLEELEGTAPWQYEDHPAILSCDTPRVEKLPLHIIRAMPNVMEKIPEARLNVFSLLLEPIGMWRNVFVRSHKRALETACENIQLANNNLKPFQAGADIGFNNNYSGIASRVTMEMMAFGVPVVSYNGEYTKYHARPFDLHSIAEQIERCWNDLKAPGSTLREETLQYARDNFDRGRHVETYIELYNELLAKK